ncbi:EAL domain, c-di-GMP-specific phosphodiesterase class I (or its enzymatically inactive variant) [Ruminococcaceae bacterium YRB3002]|nr:EAL domain, c-di-GMP-specific phosphodiesterase class I (or its enzymatically inactive variant) [Ruminococcaceae bacterium YRB3002]
MLSEHIRDKIDDAIEQGWIKVYYQPVIRSLTGRLCGFESLARWIDPEYGFLSPADFITTLEDNKLIHKLDSYVVEKVCSDIHDLFEQGREPVPVSINFSRLDFQMCDMLDVVEKAVSKYDVPRDYLHIEITESMMVSDGEFMHKVIDSFRVLGYAIWMDDFGSGYSSFNLLKDYDFDMLKMDMNFLSSMNPKSKAIMRSVISMAKDIGILTLAEGVETEDEVEFLRESGCGRLQGYFYGKPMPLDDAFRNLEDKGIQTEERKWHHFYDAAGFNARSTDSPLEIVEYDGETFRTLFMNDAYKLQIFDDLPDLEEADRRIYNTHSPLLVKYREIAEAMNRSKKPEAFYYTAKGNYMCFRGREIIEYEGKHIFKGSITNMSIDDTTAKRNELELKLRELNHLFVVVLLFKPEEKTVTPLFGKFRLYNGPEKVDMKTSTDMMANGFIHPHDSDRYRQFMDSSTFAERIAGSELGLIEDAFRFRRENGNYYWAVATVMTVPGSMGKEFLYCVKILSDNSSKTLLTHGVTNSSLLRQDEFSLLWYNFVWNSSIMFFWKDMDRRFKGVSKAFLDYFKLSSEDDIVGKRGEDMNWHINNPEYAIQEEAILNSGIPVRNSSGQCIVNGVVHHTVSSKIPVYENGRIVGLMGYIIDVDSETARITDKMRDNNLDGLTGTMNARSFFDALLDYSSQYRNQGRDFGIILIKNLNHSRISTTYDSDFSDSVLQTISDRIVGVVGTTCAVARPKDAYFTVLTYADDRQSLIDLAETLKTKIESLVAVEGKAVTIKVAYSIRLRSEEGMTDENLYVSALAELEDL